MVLRALASLLPLVVVFACTHDPAAKPAVEAKPSGPSASPAVAAAPTPSAASVAPETTYRTPPKDVVAIVDAPVTPPAELDPTGRHLLLSWHDALPGIADVARPFEGLAGIRVDPRRHAARRTRLSERLELVDVGTGSKRSVDGLGEAQLGRSEFAPDGSHLAFSRYYDDRVELWVADVASARARRLGDFTLNAVLGRGFAWMPGSKELVVWTVPPGDGAAPPAPSVPTGPVVSDTAGARATNRTYQDLLTDPHDERLFEHFATAQLAIVQVADAALAPIGEPGLVAGASPSPNGAYLLRTRLAKPFSYSVPHRRFGRVVDVVDRRSKVVRVVAELPVADEVPIGGVRTGPRSIGWQALKPATLTWIEALDEGDPKKEVDHRDRLMVHAAPFADVPTERARLQHRLRSVMWLEEAPQALLTEYDRDRRWTTTWLYRIGSEAEPRKLADRSVHDAYNDPGRPIRVTRPDGSRVVRVREGSIFLSGRGASPDGERPFVDRMALADQNTERLFEADEGTYATFIGFGAGGEPPPLVVRKESPTDPPNYFALAPAGDRQLTDLPDPHPQLSGIDKRILKYKRRDGVPLSGTLYLPPGYQEGDKLPLVVWAYPREYNDKGTAGQVRASPTKFTRLRGTSPLMFLTQGYAVLNGAAMPVVGDPETMNDTFIRQIVWAAEAAVDAVAAEGVADKQRVGIGGHSYGAFMTANLLAHSDVFKAGLARSGAYNRSLTPFGFQSERRTLWEAGTTYVDVSPLFAADKINEPILLVHGEVDANSGTYPLQSKRLFHALKGNGATARLVLLPSESHGYAARESVLHVLAESFEWFDAYVKAEKAPPNPAGKTRG